MFLTQTSSMILGPVAKVLGYIINVIFNGLSMIGIYNVGLTIILFTIAVKLIMMPLTVKQQKFTKINSIMQPEISKIQKKYRGKKDQPSMMKQNEEIQEVYAKYGTSPTGSCLQLIIQMPILFALYRVIYNIPAYVDQIKGLYLNIVTPMQGTEGYLDKLIQIKDTAKIAGVVGIEPGGNPTSNQVIDFLYKFGTDTWDQLIQAFSGSPQIVSAIAENSEKINDYNQFIFGINIANSPMQAGIFSAYLLIPISAALFQFISAKTMMTAPTDDSNPAAGMTKAMVYYMPLMSLVFCMTLPAGIGIYWSIGALIQIVQQWGINKYLDHVDLDAFIEKNKIKAAKKKAKGKKSFMTKMLEGQNPQSNTTSSSSSNISDIASISTKKVAGATASDRNISDLESPSQGTSGNRGSIASKANIMLNYDNKSNNKGGNK